MKNAHADKIERMARSRQEGWVRVVFAPLAIGK